MLHSGCTATRREGRKSAQSRPSAKTGFSLDEGPELGETRDCQISVLPQPRPVCSPAHSAGFAVSGSRGLQKVDDTARLDSAAPRHSMPPSVIRVENIVRPRVKPRVQSVAKAPLAAPARGFAPLALPAGYLTKEIVRLRPARRIVLFFPHGTGGDADDRQGNEGRHGNVSALPASADRSDIL